MADTASRRTPTGTISYEYAVLPASAPDVIRSNTTSVLSAKYIRPAVEDERKRTCQALVRRYMNQLLYGCQREHCDTPTCYTARKRHNPARRLTLLSARIIACALVQQDDPFKDLCPGKPVVPTLAGSLNGSRSKDSNFREDIADAAGDEEKENKASPRIDPKHDHHNPEVVTDKGLKDPKSFTQQLFSTVSMRMVEWIGLPPPSKAFNFATDSPDGSESRASAEDGGLPSPQEPPKFKFPSSALEVMDTGRLGMDSEPVSQTRHQEILQQPPRKRGPSLKDVTPTPHSNAKAKLNNPVDSLIMPPPPAPPIGYHHAHHHRRGVHRTPQVTPSRGGKHAPFTWESPETVRPPQSLRLLNEDICKALVDLCHNSKYSTSDRIDASIFAKQSIFYVFSNPEATLASFGGIGPAPDMFWDPVVVDRILGILYKHGWEGLVKQSMWRGLMSVFSKQSGALPARGSAGLIALSLHVLANGLVNDDGLFELVTAVRASGRASSNTRALPDIGFEDELAERLTKRTLSALAFHGPKSEVYRLIRSYLIEYTGIREREARKRIAKDFGADMVGQVNAIHAQGGWSLPRCTLEWTRTIFIQNWNGNGLLQRGSISHNCIQMFELLRDTGSLNPEVFQTRVVGERINPYVCPLDWFNMPEAVRDTHVHLLDYPYLLPLSYIVTFFRSINLDLMKKAYELAIANIRLAGQMQDHSKVNYQHLTPRIQNAMNIYFVLVVRRSSLTDDALNQLVKRDPRELTRPLKVRFADGEEGVDQGGVQQEFFALLMQEIVKPEYAMFVTDERTRISWFWEGSLEGQQKFELIGLVVGLAIYNGVTLPVNFPKALYIKLLGGVPTLDDIDDYWPELHKGLRELLAWRDGDVGDIFMRTYEYSYSLFGKVKFIDMLKAKEKGEEYLEQPVPKLKQKARVYARRTPPVDAPPTLPFPQIDSLGYWLPAVPVSDERGDQWMGSLNDVLRETADSSIADMPDAFPRSSNIPSNRRSYRITYHDLNDVPEFSEEDTDRRVDENESGGEPSERRPAPSEDPVCDANSTAPEPADSVGGRATPTSSEGMDASVGNSADIRPSRIPLPPDAPEDFGDESREASAYERAERELEQSLDMIPPVPRSNSPGAIQPRADSWSLWEESSIDAQSVQAQHESSKDVSTLSNRSEVDESSENEEAQEEEEAPLVTNSNRKDFVEDYISWLTDRSIRRQYDAFARGFHATVPMHSLKLFSPASLQNLVEGQSNTPIDIAKLEAHAKYEDGYHANHRVIKDFWAVVKGFSEERRRLLLEFVTSSARVPVGGIESIMFYIMRNGEDSERVPTSLTCFGRLLLPEYSSKKKLREKLKIALDNSKGFGVV